MLRILRDNIVGRGKPGDPLQQRVGEIGRTKTGYLRIRLDEREWGWDAADLREVQRWLEENDDIHIGGLQWPE